MSRTASEQAQYLIDNPDQQNKKLVRAKARYQGRVSALWKEFGGTIELFNQYWVKQQGKCGICKRPLKKRGSQGQQASIAQFDHCHDTLVPRGLLCMRCNVKLDWYIDHKQEIEEYLCL